MEEQPLVKVLCKQILIYTNDHKKEIIQHYSLILEKSLALELLQFICDTGNPEDAGYYKKY